MHQGHVDKLIAAWGYLGIFICVFVGNLGVPVPEESVVLAAGFLAGQGILDIKFVYLMVVLSAIAGDSSGYLIGRTGGQRLLERLSRSFRFVRRRNESFKTFFNTHGTKAVFMARFITGLRFMAGPMAGAAGMPFTQFLRWNVMGALAWCSVMVAGGYLVGTELYRIIPFRDVKGRWVALGIFLVMVGIVIFWWRERGSTAPDPES